MNNAKENRMWETLKKVLKGNINEGPNSEGAFYYDSILELMKFIELREVE